MLLVTLVARLLWNLLTAADTIRPRTFTAGEGAGRAGHDF